MAGPERQALRIGHVTHRLDRRLRLTAQNLPHIRGYQHAGRFPAGPALTGNPIRPCDVVIAGRARLKDLCLVMNNESEFHCASGLRLANLEK